MAGSETIITLDALVQDDAPVVALGGLRFAGHQASWPRAARFENAAPIKQLAILTDLLRERCASGPDDVTDAWLDQHLTRDVVADLVAVLFRGENPTTARAVDHAPNRRARRGNG